MSRTVKTQSHRKLFENIKDILYEARNAVARNINTATVMTYFEIGMAIRSILRQDKTLVV